MNTLLKITLDQYRECTAAKLAELAERDAASAVPNPHRSQAATERLIRQLARNEMEREDLTAELEEVQESAKRLASLSGVEKILELGYLERLLSRHCMNPRKITRELA